MRADGTGDIFTDKGIRVGALRGGFSLSDERFGCTGCSNTNTRVEVIGRACWLRTAASAASPSSSTQKQ